MLATPTTLLFAGRTYNALGPWYFGDFRNIFQPNVGEDQKKVLPSERGAYGTVPYGKSVSGYRITFIKRLDECLG